MSVKVTFQNNIAVMTIKGKLMGGKETDECHQKVKDLIAGKHNKIVADLSHVKWLNSKGLGMLMACFTSCANAKGAFKLAGATEKTNSLLMMTKLMTIFETFPNATVAAASF